MIKKLLFILMLQVSHSSFCQEAPPFGYGETDYKSPGIYARKEYFKTIEVLNRDKMSYKALSECLSKIQQTDNQTLIKFLQEENYYLKTQNAKLMNEMLYNKKLK